MRRLWILNTLVSFSMIALLIAPARAQSPFYEGKAINILIGTSDGGSIVAARIIVQHIGKHIPGNPTVIVQPMLGGAHIVASNHVFNTAKPDGLTLLAANPNIAIAQFIKEVRKGITAILQQSPEVQQEMVKYIKFGG